MSEFARITSIDALQTMAVAVQRFRSECAAALDQLELATHRTLGWIHHECRDSATRELRQSEDAVNQARSELRQAQMIRQAGRSSSRENTCSDEERSLQRAQRRVAAAERRVQAVRHWTRAVEHAVDEYHRQRVTFQLWLDGDLSKALAALDRMGASLESYTSLEAPKSSPAEPKEAEQ